MRYKDQFAVIILLVAIILFSLFVWYLERGSSDQITSYCYLTGEQNEFITDIAVYDQGSYIVAGWTDSPNFFQQLGVDQRVIGKDGFVIKMTQHCIVEWIQVFGGEGEDLVKAVAMDSSGMIYVVGDTNSSDFETFHPDTSFVSDLIIDSRDVFLSKLEPTGNEVFNVLLGGQNLEFATDLSVTDNGLIVTGYTFSDNFKLKRVPLFNPVYQSTLGDPASGFISQFTIQGELVWSTYYGAANSKITSASSFGNKTMIAGYIQNSVLSTTVFLSEFNITGGLVWEKMMIEAAIDYTAFFQDRINLETDNQGNLYLSGLQISGSDDLDSFVMKTNNTGGIIWEKSIGGSGDDGVLDLSIANDGSIQLVGETFSSDLYQNNSVQSIYRKRGDGFIQILSSSSNELWSSYVGGSYWDFLSTVDLYEDELVFGGITASSDIFVNEQVSFVDGYVDAVIVTINPRKTQLLGVNLSFLVYSLVVSVSAFEIVMVGGTILFGYRTLRFHRQTKIRDYLILTGIFASIAIYPVFEFLTTLLSKFGVTLFTELPDQPYIGLSITSIFLYLHAIRVRWEHPPRSLIIAIGTLLVIKLSSMVIIFTISIANEVIFFFLLAAFLAFDILAIVILILAYSRIELLVRMRRNVIAYYTWIATWILYTLGNISIVIFTILQLSLSAESSLEVNIELITALRFFSYLLSLGINYFLVFILIGGLATFFPEAVLLSEIQVGRAVSLYDNISEKIELYPDSSLERIYSYLGEAKKYLEDSKTN